MVKTCPIESDTGFFCESRATARLTERIAGLKVVHIEVRFVFPQRLEQPTNDEILALSLVAYENLKVLPYPTGNFLAGSDPGFDAYFVSVPLVGATTITKTLPNRHGVIVFSGNFVAGTASFQAFIVGSAFQWGVGFYLNKSTIIFGNSSPGIPRPADRRVVIADTFNFERRTTPRSPRQSTALPSSISGIVAAGVQIGNIEVQTGIKFMPPEFSFAGENSALLDMIAALCPNTQRAMTPFSIV